MKSCKLFALLISCIMLLSACDGKSDPVRIDSAVLEAWEGTYTVQKRKEAIDVYQKQYIPLYIVNFEGNSVTFEIDFAGTECGSVLLTPVDDSTKGAELNTVMDFSGKASVDGNLVTVDIGWWFDAADNVRMYKFWSYLFWVKDAEGIQHYYYFRLDYTR